MISQQNRHSVVNRVGKTVLAIRNAKQRVSGEIQPIDELI